MAATPWRPPLLARSKKKEKYRAVSRGGREKGGKCELGVCGESQGGGVSIYNVGGREKKHMGHVRESLKKNVFGLSSS